MTQPFDRVPLSALSPSLATGGADGAPAFELKFLLTESQAHEVETWAGRRLALDPHADAARGNAYRIGSLYLDTPAWDVFHRRGPHKRRKWRLRRYAAAPGLFLERKSKSGDRVSKRRTPIPDADLDRLRQPAPEPSWAGHWFHHRILLRQLRPACRICYDRTAFVGTSLEGPLRLTLDRDIRCAPADGWVMGDFEEGLSLLREQAILELKFRIALPALFKRLMHEMGLNPSPVSKYRLGIQLWGLADAGVVADRLSERPEHSG